MRASPVASRSTPFTQKVSSVFSERTLSQVDPFVAQELQGNILSAKHAVFLEHALGVPPLIVNEWAPSLKTLGHCKEIADFLRQLSQATNETGRYEPFANMANFVLDEMRDEFPLPPGAFSDLRFVRSDPTVIKGPPEARTPPRKPDVILVRAEVADRLAKGDRSSVFWAHILCAIKFKVNSKTLEDPDARGSDSSKASARSGSMHTGTSGIVHEDFKQLSSYPLEMLSSTNGTRQHALCMFVDGDQMQLWFYDRAGAIHSDIHLNFRTDFVAFATAILACSRLSLHQFGLLSFVKFPSDHVIPASLAGATITLPNSESQEHVISLTGEVISSRPGIVGRCSFVCGATCTPLSGDSELVVKFSFQDVTRMNEFEIIQYAKSHHVEHLPLVYLSCDFDRLSDGMRGYLAPMENGMLKYQDRVTRIIISKRYIPVYKLPSIPVFQTVIRNIFECMVQLRERAQILHRDISYTNLMADERPDGSFHGVLNDFDLAVRLDKPPGEGRLSLHRTGTLPFMALQLLEEEHATHRFQHDVESLFYVLVWISAHFDHRGEDLHHDALSSWQTGSLKAITAAKFFFVGMPLDLLALTMTPFYEPLKAAWLIPLQTVISSLHANWKVEVQSGSSQPVANEKLYKEVSALLAVDAMS